MSSHSNQATLKADVAVVGGGILGRAVALELAEQGFDVTLLDPRVPERKPATLAAGAMLGAFGEVTAQDGDPAADVDLAARLSAADDYETWLDSLARNGSRPRLNRGTVIVTNVGSRQDKANLSAIKAALNLHGRRYESVDPDALYYLHPAPQRPLRDAIFLPDEASVDVIELMDCLAREIHEHPRIGVLAEVASSLTSVGERITGVATPTMSVRASWVVLAAGVHTTALLASYPGAMESIPRLIEGKGTSLLLRTESEFPGVVRTPNREFACGLHVVPRGNGTVYLGATNRVASDIGATGAATAGEVHYLLDAAIHDFDVRLARADVVSVASGSRPLSADRRPIVGVTEIPGLAIATGTYRNGVLLAPYVARTVGTEITTGETSSRNPFAPIGRQNRLNDSTGNIPQAVLDRGAGDIVSTFLEPRGFLPYGKEDELRDVLELLVPLLGGSSDLAARDLFERTIGVYPLDEMVPELLIVASRDRKERKAREHDAASSEI